MDLFVTSLPEPAKIRVSQKICDGAPNQPIHAQRKRRTMTAAKQPKWRGSEARKVLNEDIVKGVIAGMEPRNIYMMHNGLYKPFKYERFRSNLRNLCIAVSKQYESSYKSSAAFDNDKQWYPKPTDKFVWYKSPEQEQIRKDIEQGKVNGKKPIEIRESRDEYKALPISTRQWRDYLWQEKKRFMKKSRSKELREIVGMKTKKIFNK